MQHQVLVGKSIKDLVHIQGAFDSIVIITVAVPKIRLAGRAVVGMVDPPFAFKAFLVNGQNHGAGKTEAFLVAGAAA